MLSIILNESLPLPPFHPPHRHAHTRSVCVVTCAHAHTYICGDQERRTHGQVRSLDTHTLAYTGVETRFTAEWVLREDGGVEVEVGRGWVQL